MSKIKCYGCGALVDQLEGQPHKYIGAAPGCWDVYGKILAKEYGDYQYPEFTHRLTVDTYAIQHPGEPSRQAIQSVNVHLTSLYLVLEKGFSGREATKAMSMVLKMEPDFKWLEPPAPNGRKTVLDVFAAGNLEAHDRVVKEWAVDVWSCWYGKHKVKIEKLVGENL